MHATVVGVFFSIQILQCHFYIQGFWKILFWCQCLTSVYFFLCLSFRPSIFRLSAWDMQPWWNGSLQLKKRERSTGAILLDKLQLNCNNAPLNTCISLWFVAKRLICNLRFVSCYTIYWIPVVKLSLSTPFPPILHLILC